MNKIEQKFNLEKSDFRLSDAPKSIFWKTKYEHLYITDYKIDPIFILLYYNDKIYEDMMLISLEADKEFLDYNIEMFHNHVLESRR
jgi:hypothetical protein